jgi:hypothetical protein
MDVVITGFQKFLTLYLKGVSMEQVSVSLMIKNSLFEIPFLASTFSACSLLFLVGVLLKKFLTLSSGCFAYLI